MSDSRIDNVAALLAKTAMLHRKHAAELTPEMARQLLLAAGGGVAGAATSLLPGQRRNALRNALLGAILGGSAGYMTQQFPKAIVRSSEKIMTPKLEPGEATEPIPSGTRVMPGVAGAAIGAALGPRAAGWLGLIRNQISMDAAKAVPLNTKMMLPQERIRIGTGKRAPFWEPPPKARVKDFILNEYIAPGKEGVGVSRYSRMLHPLQSQEQLVEKSYRQFLARNYAAQSHAAGKPLSAAQLEAIERGAFHDPVLRDINEKLFNRRVFGPRSASELELKQYGKALRARSKPVGRLSRAGAGATVVGGLLGLLSPMFAAAASDAEARAMLTNPDDPVSRAAAQGLGRD